MNEKGAMMRMMNTKLKRKGTKTRTKGEELHVTCNLAKTRLEP